MLTHLPASMPTEALAKLTMAVASATALTDRVGLLIAMARVEVQTHGSGTTGLAVQRSSRRNSIDSPVAASARREKRSRSLFRRISSGIGDASAAAAAAATGVEAVHAPLSPRFHARSNSIGDSNSKHELSLVASKSAATSTESIADRGLHRSLTGGLALTSMAAKARAASTPRLHVPPRPPISFDAPERPHLSRTVSEASVRRDRRLSTTTSQVLLGNTMHGLASIRERQLSTFSSTTELAGGSSTSLHAGVLPVAELQRGSRSMIASLVGVPTPRRLGHHAAPSQPFVDLHMSSAARAKQAQLGRDAEFAVLVSKLKAGEWLVACRCSLVSC